MAARRSRRARTAALGQHFLKSPKVVRRLLAEARVNAEDLVLDLGAGRGSITQEVARTGARVIAVELDPRLTSLLRERFGQDPRVSIVGKDLRDLHLPGEKFKAVSNLPFHVTTQILRKLLNPSALLNRAALVVQRGVAIKRTRRCGNMFNALVSPWFRVWEAGTVPRGAFEPLSPVDTSVLSIARRDVPLVTNSDRASYEELVRLGFERADAPLSVSIARLHSRRRIDEVLKSLELPLSTSALELRIDRFAAIHSKLAAIKEEPRCCPPGSPRGRPASRPPRGRGSRRARPL
ncbi:MAG: rRNA adenine N(6)-methyltransferase family protein [Actinobacteria bacterium]|nr:rRNA adenine N(6)-methyltransferase family protein [Actinomycetota bacterium]